MTVIMGIIISVFPLRAYASGFEVDGFTDETKLYEMKCSKDSYGNCPNTESKYCKWRIYRTYNCSTGNSQCPAPEYVGDPWAGTCYKTGTWVAGFIAKLGACIVGAGWCGGGNCACE